MSLIYLNSLFPKNITKFWSEPQIFLNVLHSSITLSFPTPQQYAGQGRRERKHLEAEVSVIWDLGQSFQNRHLSWDDIIHPTEHHSENIPRWNWPGQQREAVNIRIFARADFSGRPLPVTVFVFTVTLLIWGIVRAFLMEMSLRLVSFVSSTNRILCRRGQGAFTGFLTAALLECGNHLITPPLEASWNYWNAEELS